MVFCFGGSASGLGLVHSFAGFLLWRANGSSFQLRALLLLSFSCCGPETAALFSRCPFFDVFNLSCFQQIQRLKPISVDLKTWWLRFLLKQKSASRTRGVANYEISIPMLRGDHYFFCFPPSVGINIPVCSTPPG